MKEKLWALVKTSEPPLDERVLSVHRDSAGTLVVDLVQLRWVGMPVSSLNTVLSCCKFMGDYSWYHLVQPTDPAVQKKRVPVPGQSQLSWDRSLTSVAQDPAGTGGVWLLKR